MKRSLSLILMLPLLLTLLSVSRVGVAQTTISIADETSDSDDAAPVRRVARLTFVQGDVSFLRAGVTEWAPAVENLPLLAGDQLYTEPGARAEIQMARGNYIRLSERTALTIAELSDTMAQLEITEGIAIVRIERLSSFFQRFEVDTPNSALVLQKDGLYRIEVRGEANSELIVRRGEAEASTDEGAFRVREGHRLLVDTSVGGKLELAVDTSRDDWDQWNLDRDNTIASSGADRAPDYVINHENTYSDFYGASDLSSYGTWTNYSTYGHCWIPRVSADWAPYRSGQWIWIPAAGWTWLSNEPWGWAPYHYGRWAFLSGLGWAWIPGFGSPYRGYGYRDYRWRPALVSFFNCPTPRGNYVGWYPLAPGERWRRPDRRGPDRRGNDHAHLRYPRENWRRPDDRTAQPVRPRRGVTILPVDGFRGDRAATRPAAPERELTDWINRNARPGLPEVTPSPVAARPKLGENDRRNSRRIAVPPNEVIKRPVVTRNSDSSTRADAPRQRRLIVPRNPGSIAGGAPALIEDGSDRRAGRRSKPSPPSSGSQAGSDSGDQRDEPKTRVRLPSPVEKSNDDGSKPVRNRIRERDGDAGGSGESESSAERNRQERRRARQERSLTPPAEEGNKTEADTRSRERAPGNNDSGPSEDRNPRVNKDESSGRRERRESAPRTEPRHEQPRSEPRDQSRQERHEQKQQRQEQPRTETRDQSRQERHEQKQQRQERPQQEQRKRPGE